MSPIQSVKLYPRRAVFAAGLFVGGTAAFLFATNTFALEHLALITWGATQPLVIGLALFGGIEAAVQIWVPTLRWLQARRRGSSGK
jgi:hypothetical protein